MAKLQRVCVVVLGVWLFALGLAIAGPAPKHTNTTKVAVVTPKPANVTVIPIKATNATAKPVVTTIKVTTASANKTSNVTVKLIPRVAVAGPNATAGNATGSGAKAGIGKFEFLDPGLGIDRRRLFAVSPKPAAVTPIKPANVTKPAVLPTKPTNITTKPANVTTKLIVTTIPVTSANKTSNLTVKPIPRTAGNATAGNATAGNATGSGAKAGIGKFEFLNPGIGRRRLFAVSPKPAAVTPIKPANVTKLAVLPTKPANITTKPANVTTKQVVTAISVTSANKTSNLTVKPIPRTAGNVTAGNATAGNATGSGAKAGIGKFEFLNPGIGRRRLLAVSPKVANGTKTAPVAPKPAVPPKPTNITKTANATVTVTPILVVATNATTKPVTPRVTPIGVKALNATSGNATGNATGAGARSGPGQFDFISPMEPPVKP